MHIACIHEYSDAHAKKEKERRKTKQNTRPETTLHSGGTQTYASHIILGMICSTNWATEAAQLAEFDQSKARQSKASISTWQTGEFMYMYTMYIAAWLSRLRGKVPVRLQCCLLLPGGLWGVSSSVRITTWGTHDRLGPVHVPTSPTRELPTVTKPVTSQTHCWGSVLQICVRRVTLTLGSTNYKKWVFCSRV